MKSPSPQNRTFSYHRDTLTLLSNLSYFQNDTPYMGSHRGKCSWNEESPPTASHNSPAEHRCQCDLEVEDITTDGGLRAWLVVFGGFVNFLTGFGIMNSFGIFQGYYSHHMLNHEPVATVAWIGSVQLFSMFIGGLFVGPAFDRWGARSVMIPGAFLVMGSFVGASFSTEFYELLLSQGFLFGIRNAMLYYPTTGAIAEWFDKRRALAFGLAISGSSIGGIVWSLAISKLLDTIGFAWTNRVLGVASFPLLATACVLVRERRSAAEDGAHGCRLLCPSNISQEIFQPEFVVLSLSLFFVYMGMLVPFNWITLYAQSKGVAISKANDLLPMCYAGSVFGRIATGWIADRMGRFNVLVVLTIGTSTLIFCWIAMANFRHQVVFAILYGFFSGGLIPLGSTCVAQASTNINHVGFRMGVVMAFCSPGTLTGNPISGIIGDKLGWVGVHVFSASIVMAGAILLLWARFLLG